MKETNRQSASENPFRTQHGISASLRKSSISAWLFDVYPSEHGVTLWFIDNNGNRLCLFRQFTPSFFLNLNASDAKRAVALGARCPIPVSFSPTTRTEIYSGDSIDVLQIFVTGSNSVQRSYMVL